MSFRLDTNEDENAPKSVRKNKIQDKLNLSSKCNSKIYASATWAFKD